MAERRKCELYVVRVVPHALRDDSMTVGVVVVEPSGEFGDFRVTRDWKRVGCLAPDLELAVFELLEASLRDALKDGHQPSAISYQENFLPRGTQISSQYPVASAEKKDGLAASEFREGLSRLLEMRFGALFEVGAAKGLVTEDPVAEMAILERDYLAPMAPAERARRMGRLGIVGRMQDAFAAAGVLELLQRDIDMREFTGENDPFKVDFGFRVGSTLKMFHGLALNMSREPAVTLAYRYGRIRAGMRACGDDALLTAVIGEDAMRSPTLSQKARQGWGTREGEVASGVAVLREGGMFVRGVEEMGEIAEAVRLEVRG